MPGSGREARRLVPTSAPYAKATSRAGFGSSDARRLTPAGGDRLPYGYGFFGALLS